MPDVSGTMPRGARHRTGRTAGAPLPAPARRLLAAARAAHVPAALSRDAGRYLCNYLCWRAAEAAHKPGGPRLAAFVHVPPVRRLPVPRSARKSADSRSTIWCGPAAPFCAPPRQHGVNLRAAQDAPRMDLTRRHFIARRRRRLWRRPPPPPRRCRASASTPRNSACVRARPRPEPPAATRHRSGRAPRACRCGLRPASTAPAISSCRRAHSSSACAARRRLILTRGPSLFSAEHADTISLDGPHARRRPAERCRTAAGSCISTTPKRLRIADCEISAAGGNGIMLEPATARSRTTIIGRRRQRAVRQRLAAA